MINKEELKRIENNRKLNKAIKNLMDTNQKLADKYGATVSIVFEGKETVIAKPIKEEKKI